MTISHQKRVRKLKGVKGVRSHFGSRPFGSTDSSPLFWHLHGPVATRSCGSALAVGLCLQGSDSIFSLLAAVIHFSLHT